MKKEAEIPFGDSLQSASVAAMLLALTRTNVATSSSLALKIAIVRKEHWIAVAIFGQSALHYMTNHERAGLGVMHI